MWQKLNWHRTDCIRFYVGLTRHVANEYEPLGAIFFPTDVSAGYEESIANASIIAGNRVVFNIKGNDYRLIVAIAYRMQYVYVKFIGTHAEYDKVDAATIDQFKGA